MHIGWSFDLFLLPFEITLNFFAYLCGFNKVIWTLFILSYFFTPISHSKERVPWSSKPFILLDVLIRFVLI